MIVAVNIMVSVMLAFTVIALLCAAKLSQPRVTHFGGTALQPKAGSGRSMLPATRTAARNLTSGGAHVVIR